MLLKLLLAKDLKGKHLLVQDYSLLVIQHTADNFEVKEAHLIVYKAHNFKVQEDYLIILEHV